MYGDIGLVRWTARSTSRSQIRRGLWDHPRGRHDGVRRPGATKAENQEQEKSGRDDLVLQSRARRRQNKKTRKGRAMERRDLATALSTLKGKIQAYFRYGKGKQGGSRSSQPPTTHRPPTSTIVVIESGKRRQPKGYATRSVSMYVRRCGGQRTITDPRELAT
jgi:hypothetical protein